MVVTAKQLCLFTLYRKESIMRKGTLSKFNRKKDLWISRKHPLYMETIGFKTLYAAGILMHTRLNEMHNPFANFEFERLITKGFALSSKETITMMNMSKDVKILVDELIHALKDHKMRLFFLFDLYNVSMSEYNISLNEQKSIDLFADLLDISEEERTYILQFISSAYCKEYPRCLAVFEEMEKADWPLSMAELSYYMVNYPYTTHVYPKDIKNNTTYYFHGNCTFHGTIEIPKGSKIYITNAIAEVEKNFQVQGGALWIENSCISFSEHINSNNFDHSFITSHRHSLLHFCNSNFYCRHNGGLLFASHSTTTIEHCNIYDTSFTSSLVCNGESIHIQNTNFLNCFSKQNGGAIFIQKGTSQIHNCNFTNCNSHNGGAIFASKQTVISNCFFDNCCAVEFGSAIYYNGAIRSNIEKCEYSNCYPKDDVIVQFIHKKELYHIEKHVVLKYTTIFDCPIQIDDFGILEVINSTLYVRYTLLCKGILNMKNSKLLGHQFEGRDLVNFETPKNCSFTNCEFDGEETHGIFRAVRARLHLTNCIFRNTANGRAIYNAFLPVIDGCVFSYCQEGAVYCHAGKITNSHFINCHARSGGGIIMYGARGKIEHCYFKRCTSNYSGGAIDTSGSYHIVDCTYEECRPNNVS